MKIKYGLFFFLSLLITQQTFAAEKVFSIQQIQLHNNAKNCWVIINDKVYDITQYIKIHSSKCKKTNLTDFCGKDASVVWLEKQKASHPHKQKSVLRFLRSQVGILAKP